MGSQPDLLVGNRNKVYEGYEKAKSSHNVYTHGIRGFCRGRGGKDAKAPAFATNKTIAGAYRVAKSYPLTKTVHGIDGIIQLLQDSRLTKDDYNKQFSVSDCDETGTHKAALGAVLRTISKQNGIFRIFVSHTYEVSVAWLEAHQLTGKGRQSFLFTLDESIGMGSYAGPMTHFYDVIDGKLTPIKYLDKKTGKKEEMALMRTPNWLFHNNSPHRFTEYGEINLGDIEIKTDGSLFVTAMSEVRMTAMREILEGEIRLADPELAVEEKKGRIPKPLSLRDMYPGIRDAVGKASQVRLPGWK